MFSAFINGHQKIVMLNTSHVRFNYQTPCLIKRHFHLNTSHVKVQQLKSKRFIGGNRNLNTSHVKVQLNAIKRKDKKKPYLNTSHVKVQLIE